MPFTTGTGPATAGNDLIVVRDASGALSGGDGNDMILAGYGKLLEITAGQTLAMPVNLDSDNTFWFSGLVRENALLPTATAPHTTMAVTTSAGQRAIITIVVPAGQTLQLDIDAAHATGFTGVAVGDTTAALYVNGVYTQTWDDNTLGGYDPGSYSSLDSSGSYTNTTASAQTITIAIGNYSTGDPTLVGGFANSGAVFLAHVSLTGHATAGTVTTDTNTISGGTGDDTLSGGLGSDTLDGQEGNDTLLGGGGNDNLIGRTGADYMDGGSGTDFADYRLSVGGVVIDLLAGTAEGSDATGDRLFNIENLLGSTQSDDLAGDNNANVFYGYAGSDFMSGRDGNDVLFGDVGNDTLNGDEGNDQIFGEAGLDTLYGGLGFDKLYGGENDDILMLDDFGDGDALDGGNGADLLVVGAGDRDGDTFNFRMGYWTIMDGNSINLISIENFTDNDSDTTVITSQTVPTGKEPPANTYDMRGGNDRVFVENLTGHHNLVLGGAGDDTIIVRDTTLGDMDEFHGGEGRDIISFGGIDLSTMGGATSAGGEAVIDLTLGRVWVGSSEVYDVIAGFETVYGSIGAETIRGTNDVNTLLGQAGDDVLEGLAGDDVLKGGGGDDMLYGGEGADYLDGGEGGSDFMAGGNGDDSYVIYDAYDLHFEKAGGGIDRVTTYTNYTLAPNFEWATVASETGLTVNGNGLDNVISGYVGDDILSGGNGNDLIGGSDGNDIVSGNEGDDTVNGHYGDDKVYGGAGNDSVRGATGNDIVRGGDGDDQVVGGTGRDFLYGDAGADTFWMGQTDSSASRATADVIGDFSSAAGDTIWLVSIDANANQVGDQAFAFIGTNAFSNVAGQLRYEQVSGMTYVEADWNGDGVADYVIRLDGTHTLAATDFGL